MKIETLLDKLNVSPSSIEFTETMAVIADNYDYTPSAFTNGDTQNEAGTNEGSCKLLAFANLQGLTEEQTLALFGHYYRDDVLGNPNGSDHGNIRNFMRSGWSGVAFATPCEDILKAK